MAGLVVYLGALIVLVVLVSTGYKTPGTEAQVSGSASQAAVTTSPSSELPVVTVGEVQSASMAAAAAASTNLSAADSVSNKSISLSASAALEQPDVTSVNKPQIADLTATPELMATYTSQEGDTVAMVASKFGVSDQTVLWANNLDSDNLTAGTSLSVPVLDGIVYTVKDGDSLEAIATKYQSSADGIIAVNGIEDDKLTAGLKLLLPDGILPETERPGYKAPSRTTTQRSTKSSDSILYTSGSASGNRYAYGYCTWYAYNRRTAMGLSVGSNWGNATTWAAYARGAGYRVDNSPSVGAIMHTSGGWGGYGHVAVVESLNSDGTITISEMNYVGWNRVSSRVVSNPSAYNFIH
jgi:surface antigen